MTDEEKIEQAANAVAGAHEDVDRYYTFLAAVQWRDENPSPEVLALVEALKFYSNRFCDGENGEIAEDALAAWGKK